MIQGIQNVKKQVEDFWNTINSSKVNRNILKDEDVFIVEEFGISLIVIKVLRADFKMRPIYVGENPYKGTFKRNNEGDYHATEHEIRGMIRDQNPDGNDGMILEYYTMDDIDKETLRKYRQIFEIRNDGHVWNALDDKSFLEKLGGYRKDRREGKEGLTLAGLMMFGDGLAIRNEFDNIFMDYRYESEITMDIRWNDRITYDGTWENNLFNFFTKVTPKLTEDLKKPFKLEGIQRIDETPVHKAVREASVNLIIHADYLTDAGVLKVIKKSVYMESADSLSLSPNGNGGWFYSMEVTGVLKDVKARGVEWLNIFAVDNVLQRIADPVFVGATIDSGCVSGAKVVRKADPEEKIGVLCLEDGKPSIVEYYEMTEEIINSREANGELSYNFGVILNYLFRVDQLEEISSQKMTVHVVEKKIPFIDEKGVLVKPESPNGYKFELLVLDMIHMFDNCLSYEVVRDYEFAPIKNKSGVDSVESARALLQKNGVAL